MIISPCAMLMTPMTPKVIASPIAASSRMLPRLMPSNRLAARPTSRSRFSIEAERRVGGLPQVRIGVRSGPELVEQVFDLRVGGGAERAHRGELLCLGAGKEPGGQKALFHGCPDRRVLLGGDGLFEQRRLIGGRMPQRILGGSEPGGGIGAEQGQLSERALDRAAQAIVDPDSVGRVRGHTGNFGSGDRVGQTCRVGDQDTAIRCVDQTAVL